MSARIFLEGGGDSKYLRERCREAFHQLLQNCGFTEPMPRLKACGTRRKAFDSFVTAHKTAGRGDYVAMFIDSEDPVADIEKAWAHLKERDGWPRPAGAKDDQVLLMVTCMETWIVADRKTLREHYGADLHESALPALVKLETKEREVVQQALVDATRNCTNPYTKGKRSFAILAELRPAELASDDRLPSFRRVLRILEAKLRA